MMQRKLVSVLVFPLLGLVACQKSDGPSGGGGPSTDGVTLLDKGKEPRTAIRFRIAKGTKSVAKVAMDLDMKMDAGQGTPPMPKLPTMMMEMPIEVTEIRPNGDIRYDFEFSKVDVASGEGIPPAVIDAMKSALGSIQGLKGHAIVNDRGVSKEADFTVPEGAAQSVKQIMESMKQSLNQMSAPLPVEPVGIGGKWRVDMSLTQNGLTIKQDATYTLESMSGDTLQLGVVVRQTADPQDVAAPNLPAGAKLRLDSLTSSGTGALKLKVTNLIPVHSTISIESDSKMRATMGADAQDMKMKMKVAITITSE